eukprot:scaffold76220_cov72-Phaeocystis_antarctica.AAC.2
MVACSSRLYDASISAARLHFAPAGALPSPTTTSRGVPRSRGAITFSAAASSGSRSVEMKMPSYEPAHGPVRTINGAPGVTVAMLAVSIAARRFTQSCSKFGSSKACKTDGRTAVETVHLPPLYRHANP